MNSWIQLSFFLPLQGLTIKDNFLFSLSLHGAIYFDLAGSIWYLEFPQERKRLRRRRTLHHLWRDAQAWVSFVTTFFVNWKALLSNASSRRITRLWGTSRPHYTCWRTSRFFLVSQTSPAPDDTHIHRYLVWILDQVKPGNSGLPEDTFVDFDHDFWWHFPNCSFQIIWKLSIIGLAQSGSFVPFFQAQFVCSFFLILGYTQG